MYFEQNSTYLPAFLVEELAAVKETGRLQPLDCLRTNEKSIRVTLPNSQNKLLHSKYDPGKEAKQAVEKIDINGYLHIVAAGFGLGYHIRALLDRMTPDQHLHVIAVNIDVLKKSLEIRNLKDILQDPRLEIITADNREIFLKRISNLLDKLKNKNVRTFLHSPSLEVMPEDLAEIKIAVHDMDYLYKQSQAYMEQAQAPTPGNSTGRAAKGREQKSVLLLEYHLFIPFLKKRLQEEGFIVQCVKPAELTVQRFDQLCAMLKPSFILGVNFSGEIAFLASQRQIPYVSWTIDPLSDRRLSLIPGTDDTYCLAYAHRRKLVERLQEIGIANARYLPLAAPGDMRKPVDDQVKLNPYRCPVSFVGNALVDEHTALIEGLQKYGVDGPVINQILEFLEEFAAKEGDSFDFNGFSEDVSNIPGWLRDSLKNRITLPELAELLDGKLSSLLRIRRVQALEPVGIKVYGRKDWADVIKCYYGVADHGEELTCIYNASDVNLDIPRIYQRDIVTMRVFDILASGGLLCSEPSTDLLELFEDGRHLVTYRDTEELVKRLKDFQKKPGLGKEIAASGRKEVLAKHLIQHRFQKIMADIEHWKSSNGKTGS